MEKIALIIPILLFACVKSDKPKFEVQAEEQSVMQVLENQQSNWNKGDIDAFMVGYWKSDSLQFVSRGKIKKGWNETIAGYKKNYPDIEAMGTLKFDILQTTNLSPKVFLVTGMFYLTRKDSNNATGIFTLIFKKIDGLWLIVYDHTST